MKKVIKQIEAWAKKKYKNFSFVDEKYIYFSNGEYTLHGFSTSK